MMLLSCRTVSGKKLRRRNRRNGTITDSGNIGPDSLGTWSLSEAQKAKRMRGKSNAQSWLHELIHRPPEGELTRDLPHPFLVLAALSAVDAILQVRLHRVAASRG